MDDGMLVLRLVLGALMAGHAVQKLFGWFSGMGISGTAQLFESWGLRPGRLMVLAAGATELLGALLVTTGTLIAVAVACIVGTMAVAAWVSRDNGLWAIRGGYELPLVYGLTGLGIGLAGPGDYSVDHLANLSEYGTTNYVLIAAALALLGAAPLLLKISQAKARADTGAESAGVELQRGP